MGACGFVVISGLPAAGKTTLGRALAQELGCAFLDKDDILETSFEQHKNIGPDLRQELSRAADVEFKDLASQLRSAVLVSFWRPPDRLVAYGTPCDWLAGLPSPIVELRCQCPPEIALDRFRRRQRHPAHNDHARDHDLAIQFQELAGVGPLGAWPCVEIDTSDQNDLPATVAQAHRQVLALFAREA